MAKPRLTNERIEAIKSLLTDLLMTMDVKAIRDITLCKLLGLATRSERFYQLGLHEIARKTLKNKIKYKEVKRAAVLQRGRPEHTSGDLQITSQALAPQNTCHL